MTKGEPTAAEVWEWLAACRKCGEAHEYRPDACTCGKGASTVGLRTWAHPDDGHAYESRMGAFRLTDLRSEWAQHIADGAS